MNEDARRVLVHRLARIDFMDGAGHRKAIYLRPDETFDDLICRLYLEDAHTAWIEIRVAEDLPKGCAP